MDPKKKLLFISHEATLSGAPWVLFHLLTFIKQNTSWECRILFLQQGETIKTFENLFPCDFWEYSPSGISNKIVFHLKKMVGLDKNSKTTRKYTSENFDLIYANSVVSLKIASELNSVMKKPLIAHIHELGFALKTFYQDWLTEQTLGQVSKFITVSNVACKDLTQNWPIDKEKVAVVNSFIDIKAVKLAHRSKEAVLDEVSLTKENFIVGNCGMASWWKGTDIFIQVAAEINRRRPDNAIKFIWIGHELEIDKNMSRYDMERLGVNNVLFIGRKQNTAEYLQLLDLYFMSSRADSFGIASIEAALLGKPIMCFEDSGGIVEFVDDEIGYKMPYLDINKVADKIIELSNLRDELSMKGESAARKAPRYDVSVNAPFILDLINTYSN